jgi:Leucine-rich repeat (LRR) protein
MCSSSRISEPSRSARFTSPFTCFTSTKVTTLTQKTRPCQNRLNELEPQIGLQLTSLTELYVRSNFLRELPLEISHLERLSVLHLDENELREVLSLLTLLVQKYKY